MLKSMTGFARCDGARGAVAWHWEIRTVNGRGLDVRLRLPPGYEGLEQPVREMCKEALVRGNCNVALTTRAQPGAVRIRLNEAALEQVTAAMARARQLTAAAAPSLDGLLAIRGVLDYSEGEADESAAAEINAAMLQDFAQALQQVVEARKAEGAHLEAAISGQLDEIERLVRSIEAAPGRSPEAVRTRLRELVSRLIDEAPGLDEQRLYQEAVLLATKTDVHEEIDRLYAHIAAARELLASHAAVGRQLEFLAQEFNREANTICSKAGDREISQAGLALKAAVDRLREQVQNIE